VNVKFDYPASVAVITLNAGEDLTIAHLDIAVQHVQDDPNRIWNVLLIVTPEVMNRHRELLQDNGFIAAGNLSIDCKTLPFVKLRKSLRRSGDGWAPNSLSPTYR